MNRTIWAQRSADANDKIRDQAVRLAEAYGIALPQNLTPTRIQDEGQILKQREAIANLLEQIANTLDTASESEKELRRTMREQLEDAKTMRLEIHEMRRAHQEQVKELETKLQEAQTAQQASQQTQTNDKTNPDGAIVIEGVLRNAEGEFVSPKDQDADGKPETIVRKERVESDPKAKAQGSLAQPPKTTNRPR